MYRIWVFNVRLFGCTVRPFKARGNFIKRYSWLRPTLDFCRVDRSRICHDWIRVGAIKMGLKLLFDSGMNMEPGSRVC